MVANSNSDEPGYGLSEEERARVRAEMRYAMLVFNESDKDAKAKSTAEKWLGFLANGFVLLLVGSLITSFLVPHFQHEYDRRKQRLATMQECFSQFRLYTESVWQEYFLIIPLSQKTEITGPEYLQYVDKIKDIKLRRLDAYTQAEALAVVFRVDQEDRNFDGALARYAVRVNLASAEVDTWLVGLYCTPVKRNASPCATFDPLFDSFKGFQRIQSLVLEIGDAKLEVGTLMMKRTGELM
jgi:hypothetical protein